MSVKRVGRNGVVNIVFKERYYSKHVEYYPFFHQYMNSETGEIVGCLYFSAVSRKDYIKGFFDKEEWEGKNGILIWCSPI
jgi:hypothetical protein